MPAVRSAASEHAEQNHFATSGPKEAGSKHHVQQIKQLALIYQAWRLSVQLQSSYC
jgi:hypothetical protein